MEFVLNSVRDVFISEEEWIDKYVDPNSSLYKEYRIWKEHESERSAREMNIKPYHNIWVDIMRHGKNYQVERFDKTYSCILLCKDKRQLVMLNGLMPIAIINRVGHCWKYVSIPPEGIRFLNSHYLHQLY